MPAKPAKSRADQTIVALGLASNEKEAAARIMTGKVIAIDSQGREHRVEKAGEMIDAASEIRFAGKTHPYVSRGGLKLAAALDAFGIDPAGRVCADIGISTGGFTDCLLSRGAARVYGVDVGYGQTAWRIRTDPRVVLLERTNVRAIEALEEPCALLVVDLSFIRLAPLLAKLRGIALGCRGYSGLQRLFQPRRFRLSRQLQELSFFGCRISWPFCLRTHSPDRPGIESALHRSVGAAKRCNRH